MASDIRVAVLAHSTVAGGAEAFLVRLYQGLAQRGIEGVLVGGLPGWESAGLPRVEISLGPKWSRSSAPASLRRACRDRNAFLSTMARVHGSNPFDVAHMQYKREQLLLTRAVARSTPVLWSEHGTLASGGPLAWLQSRAYVAASRRVSALAPVSRHVEQSVVSLGVSPTILEAIPNCIDTRRFSVSSPSAKAEARRRLGVPIDASPIVAWLGRLDADKRPDLARETALHLSDGYVMIAGDGPQYAPLLEQVQLSASGDRPARVTLLGFLDDPRELLAAADVLLFTSSHLAGEGFPTTLLEAAASGLAIVGVADCGVTDMVREAGGIVARPDPQALADAVERAASTPSQQGRKWAESHSLDAMLDAYEHVIRGVQGTKMGLR